MPATPRTTSSRPRPPAQRPLPIQNFQLSTKHFTTDDGVRQFNVLMQQIVTSLQAVQGVAGPSVLPSGVDVQGATVSGLGAPKGESDAVSLGHAQANFSPATQQSQLDIGAPYALKGLTGLYLQVQQQQASVASGSNSNGYYSTDGTGLIRQWNQNVSVPGSLTITFPIPFTKLASINVEATPIYTSGDSRTVSVSGSTPPSLTEWVALISDAATASINWYAIGY